MSSDNDQVGELDTKLKELILKIFDNNDKFLSASAEEGF